MADLPSILGGMAQGFIDFGKGAVDLFGTGGAAIGDLVESARTGKVTTKNQDDFRKWLYNTDSTKDAAAKGLGTTLNGVQTALDYIPGVNALTRNPLGNAAQGALGGLADEFKTYGENYDLGRAGQRAAVSAAGAAASGSLADALKGSSNALLSSNTLQGLARGATGGAITGGGYAAIDGGDIAQSALQGAGTGALIGGATGAMQDFMPRKATYDMALTDDEKAARIANAKDMLANEQNPERIAELNNQIRDLGGTLADADMAVNNPRYLADENGNPRTFYHGSPNKNITEFDINQAGKNTSSGEHALYFTDSPEVADEFSYERLPGDSMFIENKGAKGRVYPVNLEMNNPLDLDNLSDAQIRELWEYASPLGQLDGQEKFIKNLTDWRDNAHNAQLTKGYLDLDKLRDSQYDGFTARMYPNQDNQAREYAVFDNSKVKMLDDVLANQDLAVNNGVPIYTNSMAPETRRALDIITQRDVPVENELYNRIDPKTLPQGYEKLRNLIDSRTSIDEQVQKKLGKNPLKADVDELLDYLYPNEPLEKKVFHKSLNESIEKYKKDAAALGVDASKAAEDMTRTKKLELIKKIYDDVKFDTIEDIGKGIDVGDDLLYATQAYDRRGIRTGYPGALDTALSERLDIAPGNTIKITDSQYDWIGDDFKRKNLGRYTRNAKDISVREGISGIEGDISTMAHERLHSFQNEARPENAGRYSKEVTDAYNELSKDLKPYIKDDDSIAKIYGASDTNYYASPIEQESRMLQTYLDNKGYTKDALYWRNKQNGGNPEWGNEINPAFDKFFDKLRDLSKRGIALPALTALFGGGAYMASQNNDKEKEVK